MNMMQTMSYEQQLRAKAIARKAIFFGPTKVNNLSSQPKPKAPELMQVAPINPKNRGKRPLWCIQDIKYDDHVRRYYGIAKTREKGPTPKVTIANGPRPLWATGLINFNSHVIAYKRHELVAEEATVPAELSAKTMDDIAAEVLSRFESVNLRMLKGISRTKPLILPRQLIMFEIKRQKPELSFHRVGQYMGGRDHSTALHAVRKIQALKDEGKLDWFYNARDSE